MTNPTRSGGGLTFHVLRNFRREGRAIDLGALRLRTR
jgi:hypothetical protein